VLLKEERALVRSKVEACLLLSSQLDEVGAYFNENNVLEHTWTTSTLPQLDLAIQKVCWLDRPSEDEVPRHIPTGTDARGFTIFRFCDGTNVEEAAFGEIEKTISANGGYSEKTWQGLLLNKVQIK
jgi:hypothetical protein